MATKTKTDKYRRNIFKYELLDDYALQTLTEELSLEFFGLPFEHKCTWNNRLKTTGGRYFGHSHNIDISSKNHKVFGINETIDTIKHELTHYHLHKLSVPWDDADATFKYTCDAIGAPLFCGNIPFEYHYQCSGCKNLAGSNYMHKANSIYCKGCSAHAGETKFFELIEIDKVKRIYKEKGWKYE